MIQACRKDGKCRLDGVKWEGGRKLSEMLESLKDGWDHRQSGVKDGVRFARARTSEASLIGWSKEMIGG